MKRKYVVVLNCIFLVVTSLFLNVSMSKSLDDDYLDQQQIYYNQAAGWGSANVAQSFKPTVNMLTKVELMIYRKGNTSGNLDVSIRSVLNESDLTSTSIVAQTIPNNLTDPPFGGNWIEFDFPDITVTPEQTYYIVIIGDASWDGSNIIMMSMSGGDLYPRGDFWRYTGFPLEWQIIDVDDDAAFKTYGYWINQPPTVEIIYPLEDQIITNTVNITGTAIDTDGSVALVELMIDGDNYWFTANGTTSWYYNWNVSGLEDGEHTIYARSYDGEDYSSYDYVNVIVNNSIENQIPIVTILYPNENDTVNGTIIINGSASDPNGNETIYSVEVKIDDGNWNIANGTTNWSYNWDTTIFSNGIHTIYSRSYDGELYSEYFTTNVFVNNNVSDIIIEEIKGGYKFNVRIKNNGLVVLNNIPWAISLNGGVLITKRYFNDLIHELEPDESINIKIPSLYGIGRTTITVTASDATRQATAFVIGPFALGVNYI